MAQALFKSWFVDFDPVIDNTIQAGNPIPEELQARAEKRRRVIAGDVIAREERPKQSPDVIAGNVIASDEGARQSYTSLKPLLHTNPSLAAKFPASFVFNETLGKWIPEGWEVRTIKEFGKVVCGKTPSKSNPDFYGGSIPFVKIPNMHNEVFVLSTDEYLTEKGSESQANKLIPPGSISVSCIATVGKVIITNQPCHTNQQINSVVPNELIYRYFLYFTMLNLERHFHDLASAGSTTLNMNTSTFSNISILFPSKEVLSEFHKLVFPKFSKILQNQMEKETLTNLRDRLLPELISGRVRVNKQV